ncbi:Alpha/Beta hydrolase protein [Xylariales sp. PMI_506]|nr:Alpha/Beta hydrolase protein [Xylariales sp. PMI_506]
MSNPPTTTAAPADVPAEAPAQAEVEAEIKAEDLFPPHILAQYHPYAVEVVLRSKRAGVPPTWAVSIEDRRANPDKYKPPWSQDPRGWDRVAERGFPSDDGEATIPVMVYHPDPEVHGKGPYGVHINYHGGGFVLGDLEGESAICRSMSEGAGVVVIDVNYRHCPEAPWGKAIEDGFTAVKWVRSLAEDLNIKPDSLSIGGISAGGHISITVQQMARDAGIPMRLCMASVPPATGALGYTSPSDSPFPSFVEFADGPILPWESIKFFGETAWPPGDPAAEARRAALPDWWVVPLAATNWSGLCPTLLRTASCDPLRDEGEAYGRKLVEAGNEVTFKRYLGSPHVFMFWTDFEVKKEYDQDSIRALKQAHGPA